MENQHPRQPTRHLCSMRSTATCIFTCAALFFLLPVQGTAQGFRVDRFSIDDGLSQSDVNAILQDRRGFLWIATQDGLNRYDGYGFRVYTRHAGDSTSLPDSYIWSLCEDSSGALWLGTNTGGLVRYDPLHETFATFASIPGDTNSIPNNNVTSLAVDASGQLWIGTWGGGLCCRDPRNGRITRYQRGSPGNEGLAGNRVYSLTMDGDILWVGTWEGLCRLNVTTGAFQPVTVPSDIMAPATVYCITIGLYHDAWVGSQTSGLFHLDSNAIVQEWYTARHHGRHHIPSMIVRDAIANQDGTVLLATGDAGLVLFDPSRGVLTSHNNNPNDAHSLSHDVVSRLYRDGSGRLWIGTQGGGLNMYDPRKERFKHYHRQLSPPEDLGNNVVRAFLEDDQGNLWVGTSGGGVTVFNAGRTRAEHFTTASGHLSNDFVLAMCRDVQGAIWVGTLGGGLNRYDERTGTFTVFRHDPGRSSSISDDNISSLHPDSDGILWVGTAGAGLDRFDPRTGEATHFRRENGNPHSLSGTYIWTLYVDNQGTLWVGTWGAGLNRYDKRTGTFTRFTQEAGQLTNNTILSMYEDAAGMLWVGTSGGGLLRFERNAKQFTVFTEQNGLPNNVIYAILSDGRGSLWLSTNRGLSHFLPGTEVFRNYTVSDGLQSNEFNQGAALRLRNGAMVFGGINGFNEFHPDSIHDNPAIPPVVLTAFRVFGNPVYLDTSITYVTGIALPYDWNFLSFEFAALDFTAPARNQYAYKLEGFDKDWVQSGTRRFASYTNLDPGTYTFRVRGSNNDGTWNMTGTGVRLVITPPFWGTWWFRFLAVAGVVTALWLLVRRRLAVARREKEAREEFARQLIGSQERERQRIAAELHDSLGQNLLIIKNRAQLGITDAASPGHALEQFSEISTVAAEAIDEVRHIAYNLRPYQIDRLGLTKALHSIVTRVAQPSSVRFSSSIADVDTVLPKEMEINLYRIVQEGVNNIIRHASATEARVDVIRADQHLIMTIADNGRGFDASRTTSRPPGAGGFGLRGIAERVRILGGTLTIASTPGNGTTLTISLPTAKAPAAGESPTVTPS